MAIRGRLDHLKLFMVFRSILEKRMTGVLTLQSGESVRGGEGGGPIIKRAEIAHGYPVRTASNQRRDGLVFALVDEGLISSTEEQALREQAQQTRTPIDVMALQMGLVAPRRLQSIQQRVARQILLEPFSWSDGLFQFEEATIRPEQNAHSIDLIDILLEAAAKTVNADTATLFVARYAQQLVCPTELLGQHRVRFNALFAEPNVGAFLDGPTPFEVLARQRVDRRRAAQEVAGLVLAGLARFQLPENAESAPPPPMAGLEFAPEPEPPRPQIGIRRATAPANLARATTSVAPPPVSPGFSRPPGPVVSVTVSRPPAPGPTMGASQPPAPMPTPGPTVSVMRGQMPGATPARGVSVVRRAADPGPVVSTGSTPPRPAAEKPPPDEKVLARLREARERAASLEKLNHYQILGISQSGDVDAVRNAFRALARDFHADRFARYAIDPADLAAAQRYFIAINRAAEVLSNPDTRREYDAGLALASRGGSVVKQDGSGPDIARVFRAEKLVREAVNLIRNGVFEAARDRVAEALQATPDDPLGRACLAYAEFMVAQAQGGAPRSQVQAALQVLGDVTSAMGAGGREEPYYYMGRIFALTGQPERAADAFHKAIKINPHCAEAVSELRHLQRKPQSDKKDGLFGPRKKA